MSRSSMVKTTHQPQISTAQGEDPGPFPGHIRAFPRQSRDVRQRGFSDATVLARTETSVDPIVDAAADVQTTNPRKCR